MASCDSWEADQSMLQRKETGPGGTGWHGDKHHRCHCHLSHPGHLHCLRHLSCRSCHLSHLWHLWHVLHWLHHGARRRLHWPWSHRSHQSRRWWHRSPPWHCGRHGWRWRLRLDWDLRLAPRASEETTSLNWSDLTFLYISIDALHIYTGWQLATRNSLTSQSIGLWCRKWQSDMKCHDSCDKWWL